MTYSRSLNTFYAFLQERMSTVQDTMTVLYYRMTLPDACTLCTSVAFSEVVVLLQVCVCVGFRYICYDVLMVAMSLCRAR